MSRQRATRRVSLALLCAGTLGLTAGCSSTSPSSSAGAGAGGSSKAVKVDAQSVPGVGQVLVTSKGYVLYVFEPDHHRTVTCTGACAGTWPPLMASGADPIGGPGVEQALFGSDPDPVGGRVVTYDGWPLYGYTGDLQPDQATGQDINTNGGKWYAIRPSGQLVETEP